MIHSERRLTFAQHGALWARVVLVFVLRVGVFFSKAWESPPPPPASLLIVGLRVRGGETVHAIRRLAGGCHCVFRVRDLRVCESDMFPCTCLRETRSEISSVLCNTELGGRMMNTETMLQINHQDCNIYI